MEPPFLVSSLFSLPLRFARGQNAEKALRKGALAMQATRRVKPLAAWSLFELKPASQDLVLLIIPVRGFP